MNCPSTTELEALLRGGVSAEAESVLGAHLAGCPNCRRALEELAGGTGWLLSGKPEVTQATTHSPVLDQTIRKLETEFQATPEAGPEDALDFLTPCNTPGTIGGLGAYEVLDKIASGGMGIVLRARDPGLNRIVAIKVLAPALARNSLARARFIREARAAAAVVHEHVVPIYAVEEINGLPCIIMQFVKGRTLAERLRASGPMRLEEILRIGFQAAAGLAAAHAQGLVHRDIKPGNILLENSVERVKLTDFGLARAVDDTELTRTGQMAGTPEFMAPEQAGSGEVDQRADLFSLGCVLYAMATGHSPFRGGSTMAVLRRVCDESPKPLTEVAPRLPRWLDDFVLKLLAKSPANRFQTAAEVAALLEEQLQRLQRGGPEPELEFSKETVAPRIPQRRNWLQPRWVATGSIALTLIVLAMLTLIRQRPEAKPVFAVLAGNGSERGGFPDWHQAIAAAQSGDTIELRTDGRVKCAPVLIQGKSLRLRAGPDVQPVILFDPGSSALLKSDSPLVLEGLAFKRSDDGDDLSLIANQTPPALKDHANIVQVLRGARPAPPAYSQTIVTMHEATLLATHCRFTVRDNAHTRPDSGVIGLRLAGSLRCELRHCELQCLHGTGVEWDAFQTRQSNLLALSHCVYLGRTVINLIPGAGAGAETTLQLEQCTLASVVVLHTKHVGSQPVAIKLKGNVIDTASLLDVLAKANPMKTLTNSWHWEGRDNCYSTHRSFLQSGPPGNDPLLSLEAWRDFWKSGETNCFAVGVTFPKLPLSHGSQTNYTAAQMEFVVATGEKALSLDAIGAIVSAVGPGRPYHEWKRTSEAVEWERTVAAFLSASR